MAAAKTALLAILVLIGAAFVPCVVGQVPDRSGPPDKAERPEVVVLPSDPAVRRRLEAARDYIKERHWEQVGRLLQSILDSKEDNFLKTVPPGGRGAIRWSSARAEADHLLVTLPAAGKEAYRATWEAQARQLLDDGLKRRDPRPLIEAARRFRCTQAGAEALAILGRRHLDRGQVEPAAACFRRLLEVKDVEVSPRALLDAALAFRAAGDTEAEESAWAELKRRTEGAGLRVGPRTLSADELRRAAASLALMPGQGDDWPLFRGDPRRTAMALGTSFLPEALRRVPTAGGEAFQWIASAARAAPPGSLPGASPLALGHRVVYRSTHGVHAVDADTGRPLWSAALPLALGSVLRDPGRKVQVQHWLGLYANARCALYENTVLGTLSSDGRFVFAIDDIPLPPHTDLHTARAAGQTRSFGPLRTAVTYNRLRALDVTTGAMVWEVGAPEPEPAGGAVKPPMTPDAPKPPPRDDRRGARPANPFAGAIFLGPPLPLGGELYAIMERQQDVVLVCLGAERGEWRWEQPLAGVTESIQLQIGRRITAAHLAYGDSVLVCPTGCGAVVGIDPLTRGLLWAHVYREAPKAEAAEDGAFTPAAWLTAWKASAPLVASGRIVYAPPDADALLCLRCRDGAPLWKVPKAEDDLYVAGVLAGRVLIVGRTGCRALRLEDGQTLWRKGTGMPSGLGVAAGSTYYLPLADGAILGLDVLHPEASARRERSVGATFVPGNLVFHRGSLWSQGRDALCLLASLDNRLKLLEQELTQTPSDGRLLAERARLRLGAGDALGAVADLRAARARPLSEGDATSVRRALFEALTVALSRDFSTAEKYLDEYRALAEETAGPGEAERRHRQMQVAALLARGREGQGRILDALAAYREVLDLARPGDFLTPPEDASLSVRPEVWAQEQVASLFQRAGAGPRKQLLAEAQRDHKDVDAAMTGARLERFLALYGAVEVDGISRQARLTLARQLAHKPDRRCGLQADLLLRRLEGEDARPAEVAQALYLRAGLLTRHGLLDEAAACYRRLGTEFADVPLGGGLTGAGALAEAAADPRLLPNLPAVPPEAPAWAARPLRIVERPGTPPLDPLMMPCLPRQPVMPASPGTLGDTGPPSAWRGLRFFLDGHTLQLVALQRDTGRQHFAIPLPLARLPACLKGNDVPFQIVDDLFILAAGPALIGIDLLQRQVRWVRDVADDRSPPGSATSVFSDGTISVLAPDHQTVETIGWVGPVRRRALYVFNHSGLACLDPVSGITRWRRKEVLASPTLFGDDDYVLVVEMYSDSVRSVRALRAADGATVTAPEASAVYSKRLRILGRNLLASDEGPRGELRLRLYDPAVGKDLWARDFPPGSVALQGPLGPLAAVAAPDGALMVIDLATRRELPRMKMEAKHVEKIAGGIVMADATRIYVALQRPEEMEEHVVNGPNVVLRGVEPQPVHGMVYAFDRATGAVRWYSRVAHQCLVLERFDELPVLLFAASVVRQNAAGNGNVSLILVRSIDKRTGKIVGNRERPLLNAIFQTFQIDPRAGTFDLSGPDVVLCHEVARP